MKSGTIALLQDDMVFVAMDTETAREITSLLDSHVAGDVMSYGSPAFEFLRSMTNLGLPYRHLHRDKELSQFHGHSVVFRDVPEDLEETDE